MMKATFKFPWSVMGAVVLSASFLTIPQLLKAETGNGQQDASSAIKAKLDKSQFKDVRASMDSNGIATLTGTVELYEYKADADKRIHKVKGVVAVRNDIQVAGPEVSDAQLQKDLSEKLAYDRVGYGNAFTSIGVQVQNGVATLGGHARWDPDKDSALALVATTRGVKDVVDNIEVDPPSFMDDDIRLRVARAIYGYPSLQKYAMDPAKPIRISVQNGNVELYGMVNSKSDRDVANIQAMAVPGIFSVKNYLKVANEDTESKK